MKHLTRSIALLFVLTLLAAPGLHAQPTAPILRIETGMHTTLIRRIATDAANRYLITASDDKTARVWDYATGRLLQILRPPISAGRKGNLYAVAITPDGRTVACGGWTTGVTGNENIYVFDRATGALTRRITGLENVINDLAFSPDGRFLAATLVEGLGVRLYATADYRLIGTDRDYGDRSLSVTFDGHGRMATTCYDGFVRLYEISDRQLRRIAAYKPDGAERPYGLAFSPDGKHLAVGFEDAPHVAVLMVGATALTPAYTPETQDIPTENDNRLESVAWSLDGEYLYAGGKYRKWDEARSAHPVRRWEDGGRGAFTDLRTGAANTIMDLAPGADGGVAFGAAGPAFGVLDAAGQSIFVKTPEIADYRNLLQGFRIPANGAGVQFAYALGGASPARFTLGTRLLIQDPPADPALLAPRTAAPGLDVTGWKDTREPKRNGKAVALSAYELSRSLALLPDASGFLLGTDWYLRFFAVDGTERWSVDTPGAAWAVNLSGNGKLTVAAFGDGTIRWFRVKDGQELLVFFPHADRKRWVLWTPSGYYDASPGGDDLIGWHVNRGADQAADFFSVGKFRSTSYRPDVIDRILDTLDEAEALRLANADANRRPGPTLVSRILPPVVRILAPQDGDAVSSSGVTLRYSVRADIDAPVTALRVLVDGRPLPGARGMVVTPNAGEGSLQVTIPERDCDLTLLAENRHGVSEPAAIRLRWAGRPPEPFVIKPKLYLLSIGVSTYSNPQFNLTYPDKDARDVTAAFTRQQGGLYSEVVARVLTNREATKDGMLDGLDWLQRETTAKDVAILFLSSHGMNDPNGIFYILPFNADADAVKRTCLPYSDIMNTVSSVAGKILVFLDACHSGNVTGDRRKSLPPDINDLINELTSAENGAIVFSSASGRQVALENDAWGNGAFTKALVEGLNGMADYQKTGRITLNMLDLYISERVKELTNGKQTPVTDKPANTQDFPIAVKR